MTISEINQLDLLDQPTFEAVLNRTIDFSGLAPEEMKYTIVPQTGSLSLYDRLMVNSEISVPGDLESLMDAEFLIYQSELLIEENARLAQVELDRISDLVSRIDALSDFRLLMNRIDSSISNPALYRQSIINAEESEAMISALEAEQVLDDSEKAAVQYIEDRKAAYPSLEDQMDMKFHDEVNGTSVWKDKIAAIKLLYPKP